MLGTHQITFTLAPVLQITEYHYSMLKLLNKPDMTMRLNIEFVVIAFIQTIFVQMSLTALIEKETM